MLKRVLSIALSAILCAAMFASGVAEEAQQVKLYYPSYLQESEGEALVLDKMPERIVCLSNAALQILVRCGIQPVAVTEPASSVEYPDWVYELPVISTSMTSLDSEAIIAMEPDLLIVGSYQKETYGQQFADAGIPVYYTSEGPSIAYAEAREEAITLARSFGSEELAAEVEAEFAAVEARAADYAATHDVKSMMIFFHTPGTYFQTSEGYLGSMLAMLPFENLADTVVDPASRTVPTDIETCLTLDPEVIFAISPTAATADVIQDVYEETFAQEPGLWEQFSAVANDDVIYLSSEYTLESLMEQVSMVFQRVYLFADTIENNIRFGRPQATHEEVVAAAKKACCHDFIMALPDGYDTVIGEGGATLSGGEKQRISIARAMLKDAPIIIFDEATANVDPENEDKLQQAMEALTQDKTILMIAHRLKTVREADQILVLDKGRIVQRGTHTELAERPGLYRDFLDARKEAAGWKLA